MSGHRTSIPSDGAGADLFSGQASFGRYLQAIRTGREIGLEQVAEETRIAASTLKAIEDEDFDRLPPDVFLRGFLRAYAKTVGADPDEAVRRYDARLRLLQPSAAAGQALSETRPWLRGKLAVALVLLAGLVAATLVGYQQWRREPPEASPAPPAVSADAAAAPPSAAAAPSSSEAVKRPQMPATSKHVLTVTAQEDSWVKVSIDQGTPSEHTLKAGAQVKLEGQNGFNLLIGNAGGVRLSLDGKPVQVPGKRGEVVNLHLP
ncbi:MAG: helix-turn-helix domain-containing protein [Desulfobacterales bacterium]|jgi:cytoskeletal protein RodZ|nr:helix-turn-helix domain-containing protein [Desulfobacterales bacterium]